MARHRPHQRNVRALKARCAEPDQIEERFLRAAAEIEAQHAAELETMTAEIGDAEPTQPGTTEHPQQ